MSTPKINTPSTLADQIRARLDAHAHEDGFLRHADARRAIGAVLDLHAPVPGARVPLCCCANAYPCRTVSAVAAALGVPVDGPAAGTEAAS